MFTQRILRLFSMLATITAAFCIATSFAAEAELFTIEKAKQMVSRQGQASSNVMENEFFHRRIEWLSLQKNAPRFFIADEMPVMRVAVLNRTKLVSDHLLKKVLKVVKKQVKHDFAPYYGMQVKFYTFENESEINWDKFVPLMIVDLLIADTDAIGFHDLQDSSEQNGDPISVWIANPPPLPDGIPYMIIPMGTPQTTYGVVPSALSKDPSLPPTFNTILSNVVSHEVLETLADFSIDKFFSLSAPTHIDFYSGEICDPVEFNPGYVIDDFNVANFVLPSWFVPNLGKGPFDFLNKTRRPFTPFEGEVNIIRANQTGDRLVSLDYVSAASDPKHPFFTTPEVIFAFAIPKVHHHPNHAEELLADK